MLLFCFRIAHQVPPQPLPEAINGCPPPVRAEHRQSTIILRNNKDSETPVPIYQRDLAMKLKLLNEELFTLKPASGHCRIEVSRSKIFEVRLFDGGEHKSEKFGLVQIMV